MKGREDESLPAIELLGGQKSKRSAVVLLQTNVFLLLRQTVADIVGMLHGLCGALT